MTTPYRVAALYKFTRFDAPADIQADLKMALSGLDLCGTLLVAPEGLNGTIAAPPETLDQALAVLRALPGCSDPEIKYSNAPEPPFRRLKVRLKHEIVTMGVEGVDPAACVGTYVAPTDWNALISDPDTLVIDTRNDYEVKLGTFEGAINPATTTFRAFPDWFRSQVADGAPKRIAMFCTGGIRCEKATSYARRIGIVDVFHLKGGILKYLETIPETESLWRGECFVFDERVAVRHGLDVGEASLCRACKYPVTADDRAHATYEPGVSCPRCIHETSSSQKARFRERQRQISLAKARGEHHLGSHGQDGPS